MLGGFPLVSLALPRKYAHIDFMTVSDSKMVDKDSFFLGDDQSSIKPEQRMNELWAF